MATSRKSSNVYDEEKILAQFTSGQLVVALSVAIFVCCVCYLLGMLTERYYAARQEVPLGALNAAPDLANPAPATVAPEAPPSTPEPAAPNPDLLARVRTQSEPRETRLPEAPASRGSMPPLPASGERPARSTTLAIPSPPPTRQAPPVLEGATPTEPAAIAEEDEAAAPEPQSEPTPEPEASAPDESVQVARKETPSPPAASPAPAPEPAAPTPPSRPAPSIQPSDPPADAVELGWGAFGVQLAAFSGTNGEAQAREYQQILKKKHDMDSEVIQYEDGYHRVLKVGFKDKAAAAQAAEALRKQDEFKGAFLKPLP